MNTQVAKVFRKWCQLRGLPYKTTKHMYEKLSFNDKREMLDEAFEYVRLVNNGTIEPSVALLPTEAKVTEMVKKTMVVDHMRSNNINSQENEATGSSRTQ